MIHIIIVNNSAQILDLVDQYCVCLSRYNKIYNLSIIYIIIGINTRLKNMSLIKVESWVCVFSDLIGVNLYTVPVRSHEDPAGS